MQFCNWFENIFLKIHALFISDKFRKERPIKSSALFWYRLQLMIGMFLNFLIICNMKILKCFYKLFFFFFEC